MNSFLTTSKTVEERALALSPGHWFTIQDINNGHYSSREWLHYDELSHRRFKREDDAVLIQSQQDRHYFCWQKLGAS